jgi:hypothetical protein
MAKYVKAIATMLLRFKPEMQKFNTATYIADILGSMPFGNQSSLRVDADILKSALHCTAIRDALTAMYPLHFDFQKCKSMDSTINTKHTKFLTGYQIRFLSLPDLSVLATDTLEAIANRVSILSKEILMKCAENDVLSKGNTESMEHMEASEPNNAEDSELEDGTETTRATPTPTRAIPTPTIASPTHTRTTKAKKWKKLKASLYYLSSKRKKLIYRDRAVEVVEEEEEDTIGQALLKLIKKSGVFTEIINGKETLSVVTGLLVQDLMSNCGCSANKMPMIIATVISMLFGLVDADSFRSILRATDTYSLAAERTAEIVVHNGRRRFVERDAEDVILNAYLILDASNKKNKGLVAKPITYETVGGVVKAGAL